MVLNGFRGLNTNMTDFANLLSGTAQATSIESNSDAQVTTLNQIKIPKDGLYILFGYIGYQANPNGYRGLYMSGGRYKIIPAPSGITMGMTGFGLHVGKSGDVLSLQGLQNSGTTLSCDSQFYAVRIG